MPEHQVYCDCDKWLKYASDFSARIAFSSRHGDFGIYTSDALFVYCAYCGRPLALVEKDIDALRAGSDEKEDGLMSDQNIPYTPNFVISVDVSRGSVLGSLVCRLIHKKQLHYYPGPYYVNDNPYYYRHCSICTHNRWLTRDVIKAFLRGDKLL